MTIDKRGRRISLRINWEKESPEGEVRLFSRANATIMEYSDVSPFAPTSSRSGTGEVFDPGWGKKEEENRKSSRELRFPVVDICLEEGMEGIINFDLAEPGEYCLNGGFYPETREVGKTVRIAMEKMEHWDNAILLNPKSNRINQFYIATKVQAARGELRYEFETLREDWCGRIEICDGESGECLAQGFVEGESSPIRYNRDSLSCREEILQSLCRAADYLVECKNTKKGSPTEGGQFLLYDMAGKTRLRSDWPWIWGPSAQMLLKASELPGISSAIDSESLREEALSLGEASLKQQILDKGHPAWGLVRTTIEPGPLREHGFSNRASAADTLFLVGWGWIPLYKATGDRRYRTASERVAEAVGRLIERSEGGVIPQAYNLKKNRWDKNMFFESSMSLRGLADLYLITGRKEHRRIMRSYAEKLISAFERDDGLWDAMLYSNTGEVSSCNFFTKSFGYCVDGLLAVEEADPEMGYLGRAVKITEHVLNIQGKDGSWPVRLDRPTEEVGITDKGTALWACLFLRLYRKTGDDRYRKAGMDGLEWCRKHQYNGEDSLARGGIVGRSWPSGIIYRHWFDMITTYTVAFYGLAIMEALELDLIKET